MKDNCIILEDQTNSLNESYTIFNEDGSSILLDYDLEYSINKLNESINGVMPGIEQTKIAEDAKTAFALLANSLYSIPRNINSIDADKTKKLLQEYLDKNNEKLKYLRNFDGNIDSEKLFKALKNKKFKDNVLKFLKTTLSAVALFTVSAVVMKTIVEPFRNSKKIANDKVSNYNNEFKKYNNGNELNKKVKNSVFSKEFQANFKEQRKNNGIKSIFSKLFTKNGNKLEVSNEGKKMGIEYVSTLKKIGSITLLNSVFSTIDYFHFSLDGNHIVSFFPKTAITTSNSIYPAYLVMVNPNNDEIVFRNIYIAGKHID